MKIRNHIILPAICCALALTLGACGEEKKEDVKAETKAEDVLNFSEDGKSITGVKDKSIKSVVIQKGVTSIGAGAFLGCSNLTSIMIPDSVTSIGGCAFIGCSNLTSITIPDSVTSIGYGAFSFCSNLTSITIPDSVTSIGDRAFWGCSSLTSITIPDSVTGIGKDAFNGVKKVTYSPAFEPLPNGILINKKHKALVHAPENLSGGYTIPTGVTSIGAYAFSGCTSLTSITIPDSVTSIGNGAFSDCSNLTSITIPDSVTSIGDRAFEDCSNLTSITIPKHFTDANVKWWDLPSGCKIIRR